MVRGFILLVAGVAMSMPAAAQTAGEAYDHLISGRCEAAVAVFDERGHVPARPVEKAIYGAAICCSPGGSRLSDAIRYLEDVLGKLGAETDRWIDRQVASCTLRWREARLSGNRVRRSWLEMAVEFSGKLMEECRDRSVSPVVAGSEDAPSLDFLVAPDPSTGMVRPPEAFLAAVHAAAPAGASLAVCPPFAAASASQDPIAICRAADHFTRFTERTYSLGEPPVWTALIHHDERDSLLDTMEESGLPSCPNALGYYDWQRNQLMYAAPPGSFGTFNHELAHVLVHWGAPLLPRWFEEGLAAMYENSRLSAEGDYCSIENPWREEVMAATGLTGEAPLELLERVVTLPVAEFERQPWAATAAREALRTIQDRGNLPLLYQDILEKSWEGGAMTHNPEDWFFEAPDDALVDYWMNAAAIGLSEPSELCR